MVEKSSLDSESCDLKEQIENYKKEIEILRWGTLSTTWTWDCITNEVKNLDNKLLLLGYQNDEVLPTIENIVNMIHPDDKNPMMELINRMLDGKSDFYEIEYRMRTKDGNWKWFYDKGKVAEKDNNGKPLVIIGVFTDISKQKITDESLYETLQQQKFITENITDLIWLMDMDFHTVWLSPSYHQISGYSKEEVIGIQLMDHFTKESEITIRKMISEGLKREVQGKVSDVIASGEFEMLDKDGVAYWCEILITLLKYENGKPKALFGIGRNINERIKSEFFLKEERSRFHNLFEHSPIATWLEDLSLLGEWMQTLKDQGVTNIRHYLENNKEQLNYAISLLNVIDVNIAAVDQNSAIDKQELINDLQKLFFDTTRFDFISEIEAFWKGENVHEFVSHSIKMDGSALAVIVRIYVPKNENILDFSQVIVTATDITERVIAEEKRIESENKYRELNQLLRLMSDNMSDMLWAKDLNRNFIYVNKALCENLLKANDTEEPIGKNDMFFVDRQRALHPENDQWHTFGEICVDSDAVVMKSLKPGQFNEFGNVGGKFLFLDVNKAPILDENGIMIGTVGSARDVTAQKQTEALLKEERERKNAIFMALPDLLFVFDRAGNYIDVHTSNSSEIEGLRKQKIGHSLTEFFENQISSEFIKCINECLDNNVIKTIEYSTNIQNVISYYEAQLVAMGTDKVLAISRDVTERFVVENALRKSEIKYRQLVENINDVLFILDRNKKIVYMSPAIEKITGYPPEYYSDKNFYEFIHKDDYNIMKRAFEEIKTREFTPKEYRIYKKSGEVCWLRSSATSIFENGKINGFRGIAIDITERKNSEVELIGAKEKAEESNRLKSAFLATTNHELRTPLHAIIGFSDLIMNNPDQKDISEFVTIINQNGNTLLKMIEDIFDLALAEQSEIKVRKQTFRCIDHFFDNKVILEEILVNSGKQDQISLFFNPDTSIMSNYITSDRTKINQVLINLFKNAVKFTQSGKIEFGFNMGDDNMLTYYVRDTGIGIPKGKQDIIFEFFRQADDSHTRNFGGVGIGLAISKKITEIMHGTLTLESEQERGCTFYFTIPVEIDGEPSDLNKEVKVNELQINLEGKTILVAEDDHFNMELLKALFRNTKALIIEAPDGFKAVEMFRGNKVDLVLMDLKMPHMDGYNATKIIKSINRSVPVIAVTAYALSQDKPKAFEAGCDAIVTKPVDSKILFNEIKKYLKLK
jgi:PAS domain S-box-containing protein